MKSFKSIFGYLFNIRSPDDFWALKNVSFSLREGEVLGIIGPNGAGKSTILKILANVTTPTKGRVAVNGKVGPLIEIGAGLHPELTGEENIFLYGSILGMSKGEIRKKFDEIVEFSGLKDFLATPVKFYSSGMYLRLGFSITAHTDPDILLIDEVLTVGDAKFQKKCLNKMEEVTKKEGRTVLFVSHNLSSIRALCKRAILLREGKLVASGHPDTVIRKYAGGTRRGALIRKWQDEKKAPQNESAIIKKVAVRNGRGQPVDEIYTDVAFNVEVEFETKTQDAYVGMTIIFYDSENNCVLSTINNLEPNWYGRPMPKGKYKSLCKIPPNFFNNGLFSVSINLFGKNFSDSQMTDEILKIEILDGTAVRGDYYGDFGGVVRPGFHWQTNRL